MNIELKITVADYLHNKGKLYKGNVIYDIKGVFLGWFKEYDYENQDHVEIITPRGNISFPGCDVMVEIEYQPIYIAL